MQTVSTDQTMMSASTLFLLCGVFLSFHTRTSEAECESARIGSCPVVRCDVSVPQDDACDCDGQCAVNQKCCHSCTGRQCLKIEKPGSCPNESVRELWMRCPADSVGCSTDYDCYGLQKCCPTNCRSKCVSPPHTTGLILTTPYVTETTETTTWQETETATETATATETVTEATSETPTATATETASETTQTSETTQPATVVKSGKCPPVLINGPCPVTESTDQHPCFRDSDCSGHRKCCYYSTRCFGRRCLKPL